MVNGDPNCPTHVVMGLGLDRKARLSPMCACLSVYDHRLCPSPPSGHWGHICEEDRQKWLAVFCLAVRWWECGAQQAGWVRQPRAGCLSHYLKASARGCVCVCVSVWVEGCVRVCAGRPH